MAVYPSNIYTENNVSASTPLTGHASLHDNEQGEIIAIETYVGVENSTVNNTIDYIARNGWINDPNSPAYESTSSFSVNEDATNIYTAGRNVRFNSATTPVYATVVSSSYTSPSTTVTVATTNVPNPINSLDFANQPIGNTQITASNLNVSNPSSSQIGGLTTSNISSTAGITGSQLSSTAGITGGQLVSSIALNGTPQFYVTPVMPSGYQCTLDGALWWTPSSGVYLMDVRAWNPILTNVPTGGTFTNVIAFGTATLSLNASYGTQTNTLHSLVNTSTNNTGGIDYCFYRLTSVGN